MFCWVGQTLMWKPPQSRLAAVHNQPLSQSYSTDPGGDRGAHQEHTLCPQNKGWEEKKRMGDLKNLKLSCSSL